MPFPMDGLPTWNALLCDIDNKDWTESELAKSPLGDQERTGWPFAFYPRSHHGVWVTSRSIW